MQIKKKLVQHISESSKVTFETIGKIDEIFKISKFLKKKIKLKKKIFIYGNGGSFADASHFAGELIATYKNTKRNALPIILLSSNLASLTAWSNDFSFETYLLREISALSNPGDVLILISTSGGNIKKKQSVNLINVAKLAIKKKVEMICFVGKSGGEISKYAKINFFSNSTKTPIIQENQQLIFHLISEILEY